MSVSLIADLFYRFKSLNYKIKKKDCNNMVKSKHILHEMYFVNVLQTAFLLKCVSGKMGKNLLN